jgi:dTDP-4-amino-4,6-dideoxygalactose transaminase
VNHAAQTTKIRRALRASASESRIRGQDCSGTISAAADFQRFGTNSKMNDLEAAIGLDGLAVFWQVFDKRRAASHD